MKVLFIMDDIALIKPAKDTSFVFALAAQSLGWKIYYCESNDLFYDSTPRCICNFLTVQNSTSEFYSLEKQQTKKIAQFNLVFLRSDPPFNNEYLYRTQILDLVSQKNTLIINSPTAVRNFNEKLFSLYFSDYTISTLVTKNNKQIKKFINQHIKVVLKPLDSMGGESVFVISRDDPNTNVIIESITQNGIKTIMVQKYIEDISKGDKRILIINGKPLKYGLNRIPSKGESRANLAAGGRGEVFKLNDYEQKLATKIGSDCVKKGLFFVGLDMIGDYVTEINVTSPTCLREICNHTKEPFAESILLEFQSLYKKHELKNKS